MFGPGVLPFSTQTLHVTETFTYDLFSTTPIFVNPPVPWRIAGPPPGRPFDRHEVHEHPVTDTGCHAESHCPAHTGGVELCVKKRSRRRDEFRVEGVGGVGRRGCFGGRKRWAGEAEALEGLFWVESYPDKKNPGKIVSEEAKRHPGVFTSLPMFVGGHLNLVHHKASFKTPALGFGVARWPGWGSAGSRQPQANRHWQQLESEHARSIQESN